MSVISRHYIQQCVVYRNCRTGWLPATAPLYHVLDEAGMCTIALRLGALQSPLLPGRSGTGDSYIHGTYDTGTSTGTGTGTDIVNV